METSRTNERQIQLFVRDRMNSICPMNFFRTTDTTDTTIWKPGLKLPIDDGTATIEPQMKNLIGRRNELN